MFAKHRVAANLLMVIMIIAGAIGVDRLRTQFVPTFELDIITVSVRGLERLQKTYKKD